MYIAYVLCPVCGYAPIQFLVFLANNYEKESLCILLFD